MKKVENIHTGHRERLRTLAGKSGIKNLSEHQIVEILLAYVVPYKDTNLTAHALIKEFGSLANILDTKPENLTKVPGVGKKTAEFLSSLPGFMIAYKQSKAEQKIKLDTPFKVVNYIKNNVEIVGNENFYYACLDADNQVLKFDSMGENSLNAVSINLRDFTSLILKFSTSGVIISHTHTSGNAKPSKKDIDFTRKIALALKVLGIELLDHIIITPTDYYSFFQNDLLLKFSKDYEAIMSENRVAGNSPQYNKDISY